MTISATAGGAPPMTFREHMERAAAQTLAAFPDEHVPQIHCVTFRIDGVDQDPRHPYLAIGYSTEADVAALLASPHPPEAWEARWSYAYFPPTGLEGVRSVGSDPVGAGLHRREAVRQGLWYEDDDGLSEDERDERGERLDERFHRLCVDVAKGLHAGGHIREALGRPVPVILYDMFNPDEMFALSRAANPPELVADFLAEDPEGRD
ncbi:hypothetical protein GCM10010191_79270 [Actinomadura vinacea]|uniref:DUF4303 domain-containing protein n=1 Tax=Actinomadura vinacea TaxID=115336 RepID=A0ABN3K5V7_9ACTN